MRQKSRLLMELTPYVVSYEQPLLPAIVSRSRISDKQSERSGAAAVYRLAQSSMLSRLRTQRLQGIWRLS